MNRSVSTAGNAGLLAKYEMEPLPDSISRLAVLISNRNADLSEVARLVASDPALTAQLLGNDFAPSTALDEIERQIFRMGVEPILVLAMSDPLVRAVNRTFHALARMPLKQFDSGKPGPSDLRRYTCGLSISGRANGRVFLRIDDDFGQHLAAEVLRIDLAAVGEADVVDVLAEISNMVVGTFQSNLCDARLSCRLSVPDVAAQAAFHPPEVARGRHRVFAFRHETGVLLVDLLVEFAE